jgi:CheY-like chemotaxis protein
MEDLTTPNSPVDILIADDDAVLRSSLRHLLEQQGYACAEAGDGREAVQLARQAAPRCLFLDLAMPGLDGFAVARQLRQDPRTRGIHIHCLTGRHDRAARELALQAGCELFLTKPVDAAALLRVVRRQVDGNRPEEWVGGLTRNEAEDLLDWMEANGYPPGELDIREEAFALRCPGYRAYRDGGGQVRFVR